MLIIVLITSFTYHGVKAETDDYIKVPIIMYHSMLKSKSGDYIVHPSEFENDLKYIKEKF